MKLLIPIMFLVACGGDNNVPLDPDSPVLPQDSGPPVDLGPPRETFTSSQLLAIGEIAEAEMIGGPADRAIIKLMAPAAELDWNIHSHPGGSTINVVTENNVMTVTYDFVPTEQFEWYLLLKNTGPTEMTVDVVVDLYGAMTITFL